MIVTLERFAYTPQGTFGRLTAGAVELFTIERPWLNNIRSQSCIPVGDYALNRCTFHRGGYEVYEVMGVPDRSLIKIHIANVMDDILGCIGPGTRLGYVKGKWAVLNSRIALGEFMEVMEPELNSRIVIENYIGGVVNDVIS